MTVIEAGRQAGMLIHKRELFMEEFESSGLTEGIWQVLDFRVQSLNTHNAQFSRWLFVALRLCPYPPCYGCMCVTDRHSCCCCSNS